MVSLNNNYTTNTYAMGMMNTMQGTAAAGFQGDAGSAISIFMNGSIDSIGTAAAENCRSDVGKSLIQIGASILKLLLSYVIGQASKEADAQNNKAKQVELKNDKQMSDGQKQIQEQIDKLQQNFDEGETRGEQLITDLVEKSDNIEEQITNIQQEQEKEQSQLNEKISQKQEAMELLEQVKADKQEAIAEVTQQKNARIDQLKAENGGEITESQLKALMLTDPELTRLNAVISAYESGNSEFDNDIKTYTDEIGRYNSELEGHTANIRGYQEGLICQLGLAEGLETDKEAIISFIDALSQSTLTEEEQISTLANFISTNTTSSITGEGAGIVSEELLTASTNAAAATAATSAATAEAFIPGGQAKSAENLQKAADLGKGAAKGFTFAGRNMASFSKQLFSIVQLSAQSNSDIANMTDLFKSGIETLKTSTGNIEFPSNPNAEPEKEEVPA